MNQEVIDFLLRNDFVYFNSDTEEGYVRLFEMCPCCGKTWSAFVEIDGNFHVANDFGHVCWDFNSY